MDIGTLENERRRAIQQQGDLRMVSGGWNLAAHPPGQLPPYIPPDKPNSPWEPGKSPAPSREDKLAHHTGGKHFTEPTIDELIQGIINGDVPRGTLGDEETEDRMIQEYLLRQQQALNNEMMIAGVVGYPHSNLRLDTGTSIETGKP